MKYLPVRELDDVTNALNFNTPDCQVLGGCDLYTTKAAGTDKKLYKNIEQSLESQYKQALHISASLSPPQAALAASSLNLSRSSPFGSLSQISSRRTFAYLIATLNASHPDYDFSHLLKPSDFRREKSMKAVMNTLDTTLYNLRPRPTSSYLSVPGQWSSTAISTGPPTPGGSQPWSPRMWRLIDKEMSLRECSVYCYSPEEDPYDGEEGAIWSFNYFFFNKARKRVCYIYLRGLSMISQSPEQRTPLPAKRSADSDWSRGDDVSGAKKRARYWLGDRAADEITEARKEDEDDEDSYRILAVSPSPAGVAEQDSDQLFILSSDEATSSGSGRSQSKSTVRGMSEEIADTMEV